MPAAQNWPASLVPPQFANGYGEASEKNVLEFMPDVGPPKRRRRVTKQDRIIPVRWRYTAQEVTDLMTFYQTTIQGGALQFNMTHPRTKVSAVFLMVDPPQVSCREVDQFDVSFNLRHIT